MHLFSTAWQSLFYVFTIKIDLLQCAIFRQPHSRICCDIKSTKYLYAICLEYYLVNRVQGSLAISSSIAILILSTIYPITQFLFTTNVISDGRCIYLCKPSFLSIKDMIDSLLTLHLHTFLKHDVALLILSMTSVN